MFMGSVMTLLAAPSAELGYGFLIACRFINGIVHVKVLLVLNKYLKKRHQGAAHKKKAKDLCQKKFVFTLN